MRVVALETLEERPNSKSETAPVEAEPTYAELLARLEALRINLRIARERSAKTAPSQAASA